MKKVILTSAVACFIAGSMLPAVAANTDEINQEGDDFTAEIHQTGDDNVGYIEQYGNGGGEDLGELNANIVQDGYSNEAYIYQTPGSLANIASIDQAGDNNYSRVIQEPAETDLLSIYNRTYITQDGEDFADVTQTGIQNTAYIDQYDGVQNVGISQSGYFNYLELIQGDGDNYISITQNAPASSEIEYANAVYVEQYGNNDSIDNAITQDGEGNLVDLLQNGNGNISIALQIGNVNEILIDQYGTGNYANVSQYGDDNSVDVYQNGTSLSATITQGEYLADDVTIAGGNFVDLDQIGQSLTANITQTGNQQSATITQNGTGNVATSIQSL